jgi:hypothetical protein
LNKGCGIIGLWVMWIDLFGDEGIKNYIHMLGSSHMLYSIKKYGCLYLYSQQGWESLNSKYKPLFIKTHREVALVVGRHRELMHFPTSQICIEGSALVNIRSRSILFRIRS